MMKLSKLALNIVAVSLFLLPAAAAAAAVIESESLTAQVPESGNGDGEIGPMVVTKLWSHHLHRHIRHHDAAATGSLGRLLDPDSNGGDTGSSDGRPQADGKVSLLPVFRAVLLATLTSLN